MGEGGQGHDPAALPPGKTRYLLYRRLGGPQGRSGQVRKISPPPGFDPRIVQPLASPYTDCAIPVPVRQYVSKVMHCGYSNRIQCFVLLPVISGGSGDVKST